MNSIVSDDLSRDHLALEAAKCLKTIYTNSQNVVTLHKELLEVNLSFKTYIEESKERLHFLRLQLAQQAKSSHEAVDVLSKKCKEKMSDFAKQHKQDINIDLNTANTKPGTNVQLYRSKQDSAKNFISWYKHMIDNERRNVRLYLADDVVLEWFGRTIKTKAKVSAFFNYDMQYTRHDFKTVMSIEKIHLRHEVSKSKEVLGSLKSPETGISGISILGKRKLSTRCSSPEWAEGCKPDDDSHIESKRQKRKHKSMVSKDNHEIKSKFLAELNSEISNHGDNIIDRHKNKCPSITPPNVERGQGDCLPSTSGTDSDRSRDTLNAQLPKLGVECNGYVEFNRSKNNISIDCMKWDRKCKVQISYSEDPLNVGEYIVWALCYSDESKCRRNLITAFEEAAKEDGR